MLGEPLAYLTAGNQQHLLGARKRLAQGPGVVIVEPADLDAALGEIGDLGQIAAARDDLPGGNIAAEEGFDDEAAELAGGSGDDDGHGGPFTGG